MRPNTWSSRHGFWLYNSDRVLVETYSAELNLASPRRSNCTVASLTSWPQSPATAGAARAIINRVIDDLAPEAPGGWRVISPCPPRQEISRNTEKLSIRPLELALLSQTRDVKPRPPLTVLGDSKREHSCSAAQSRTDQRLPERARRWSSTASADSLNHIQGCPLDCAYCIRHTYGLWDQRQPRALMIDAEAVEELVNHRYFQPHMTPVQLFNRATDPFLPVVRPHTFAVLEDLDGRGLTNHVSSSPGTR